MRNRFDRQLEQLNIEMIEMGALCEDMIHLAGKLAASRSFFTKDSTAFVTMASVLAAIIIT